MDKMLILSGVARAFNLHTDSLLGYRRDQRVAAARHVAMYLLREITGDSYPALGKFFNRDHSTIIHGYKKVERRMLDSPEYGAWVRSARVAIELSAPTASVTIPGFGLCAAA